MARRGNGKDFGELFSESWNEYRKNFSVILKSYLWFYIIPGLIMLLLVIMFFNNMGSSLTSDFFKSKTSFITYNNVNFDFSKIVIDSSLYPIIGTISLIFLVVLFLNYLLYLSLFYLAFNQKKNIKMGETIKGGLKYFWVFIGLFLLIVLALIPLFLLLIIPGIMFIVYWVFSPFVLVGENERITKSMKKSFHLVRFRWWRTFGYILLAVIIFALASLVIGLPASLLAMVFKSGLKTGAVDMSLLTWTFILSFIFGTISKMITTPLGIFFFKNFYLDMKKNQVKRR